MPDLTISTPVDNLVSCADAAAMRTVLGLGTAATATLASLLSDFTYTAATRILSSASTGASATLTLADGTNPGLMASADYTLLNTITTKRLLGRNTGSTGAGEHVTVDQLLDWVAGTPGTGDILYRGAGSYARLAIGTTNALLAQGGSGAPVWTTAPSLTGLGIASGSLSSSTPITLTQTWNNAGTTFKGVTLTFTDTNSASGSLPFQILGGASGTTNLFKVDKSGLCLFGSGSATAENVLPISLGDSSGLYNHGTNEIGFTCNSTTQIMLGQNTMRLHASLVLGWASSNAFNTSIDTAILRDAANSLALRNSTNAQSLAIYNTYTAGTPDYERMRLYGGGGGADFVIAAEKSGTGAYRAVKFNVAGINALTLGTNGTYTFQYGATVNDVVFITTASLNGQNNTNGVKYQLVHDSNVPSIRMSSDAVLQWNSTNNLSGGSRDVGLKRAASAIVGVTDGSTGGGAIELQEMTAPGAGATNFARIYAEDNGSGKTRIVVKFPTGAAQVLATEP